MTQHTAFQFSLVLQDDVDVLVVLFGVRLVVVAMEMASVAGIAWTRLIRLGITLILVAIAKYSLRAALHAVPKRVLRLAHSSCRRIAVLVV